MSALASYQYVQTKSILKLVFIGQVPGNETAPKKSSIFQEWNSISD